MVRLPGAERLKNLAGKFTGRKRLYVLYGLFVAAALAALGWLVLPYVIPPSISSVEEQILEKYDLRGLGSAGFRTEYAFLLERGSEYLTTVEGKVRLARLLMHAMELKPGIDAYRTVEDFITEAEGGGLPLENAADLRLEHARGALLRGDPEELEFTAERMLTADNFPEEYRKKNPDSNMVIADALLETADPSQTVSVEERVYGLIEDYRESALAGTGVSPAKKLSVETECVELIIRFARNRDRLSRSALVRLSGLGALNAEEESRAHRAKADGYFKRAEEILRDVVSKEKLFGDEAEAYDRVKFLLGQVLLERPGKGETRLTEAARLFSSLSGPPGGARMYEEARFFHADALRRRGAPGDEVKAEAMFREMLSGDVYPGTRYACTLRLAQMKTATGNYLEALEDINGLIKWDREAAPFRKDLLGRRDVEEALRPIIRFLSGMEENVSEPGEADLLQVVEIYRALRDYLGTPSDRLKYTGLLGGAYLRLADKAGAESEKGDVYEITAGEMYREILRDDEMRRLLSDRHREEMTDRALEAFFAGRHYPRVVTVAREAMEAKPSSRYRSRYLHRLGYSYQSLGLFDNAVDAYEENMEKYDTAESFHSMIERARCFVDRGGDNDSDLAEEALREIINHPEIDPRSEIWKQAVFMLGDLYLSLGREEMAAEYFETGIDRFPGDPLALGGIYLLASSRFSKGDYQGAREFFEKTKAIKAADDQGLLRRKKIYSTFFIGECYFSEGKYLDAVQAFRYARRMFPEHPYTVWAFFQIGNAFGRLAAYETDDYKRERLYEQALDAYQDGKLRLNKLPERSLKELPRELGRDFWTGVLSEMESGIKTLSGK